MAMGSKVLEYIIRARDATAAAVQSAIKRVGEVSRTRDAESRKEIRRAEEESRAVAKSESEKAAAAVASAKKQQAAHEGLLSRVKILWQQGKDAAAGAWRQIGQAAQGAATNVLSSIAGIPGPIGRVFSQIGSMASASFGPVLTVVAAVLVAAKKAVDHFADAWKRTCETMAENWRALGRGAEAAAAKMAKAFEKEDAALRRRQSMAAGQASADADLGAARRELERERQMQGAMSAGATSDEAKALRDAWELEDDILDIERERAEVVRRINDALAQNELRINRRPELKADIADDAARLKEANDALFQRVEDMRKGGMWQNLRDWYAGDPKSKVAEGASDASKALLRAYIEKREMLERDDNATEEANALVEQLGTRLKALDAQRDTVRLARENAAAVEAAAKAEEEARRAAEEEEREARRAAEEEERRQRKLAEEQRRRMEELERERERLAEKAYRKEVELARGALAESQQGQRQAEGRLSAARSQVARAWGWYRNQDSMQAHIDDILAQREAEKQWEKDFARLQSRHRDWESVDVGKLTAAEEATRQVALARQEEQAAQKALDEIAGNTRDLAEKLDELLSMKEA